MAGKEILNEDTLHDYVVAHGFGAPTAKGYEQARRLWEYDSFHGNYADIAFSIVSAANCEEFEEEDD